MKNTLLIDLQITEKLLPKLSLAQLAQAAKNTAAVLALSLVAYAGSASEAQANTVSIRIERIIAGMISSSDNLASGGRGGVLLNYTFNQYGDPVSEFGILNTEFLPINNLEETTLGWVSRELYKTDGSFAGSLSRDIDWLGSRNDGELETSIGKGFNGTRGAGFDDVSAADLFYTYDDGLSTVPVPPAALLFATGLPILVAARKRKTT